MEFKAGLDFNRVIAGYLGFGVKKENRSFTLLRPDGSTRIGFGSEDAAWWNVPEYSTDLNLAFTLPVEEEYFLDLHSPCVGCPDWYAFVCDRFSDSRYESEVEPPYRAWAETGALALCLAWLQYYGVKHHIPGLQPEIYKYLETTEKPNYYADEFDNNI